MCHQCPVPQAGVISFRCYQARLCRRSRRVDLIPKRKWQVCQEHAGLTHWRRYVVRHLASTRSDNRRTTQSYLDRIPIPWITVKLGSSERAGACNFRERSLSQVQPLLSSLERVPARSRRLDNADRPAKLDQDVGLSGTGCVARKSVRNRRA